MALINELKTVMISKKAGLDMEQLLRENPFLRPIFTRSKSPAQAKEKIRKHVMASLKKSPHSLAYYRGEKTGKYWFHTLSFKDYAAIRILDYIDHAGRRVDDMNLQGRPVESDPFTLLFFAVNQGTGGITPAFITDMRYLFRQLSGRLHPTPVSKAKIRKWMDRHPCGLDPEIMAVRKENKARILNIIIRKITRREVRSARYKFEKGTTAQEKLLIARKWWNDHKFHIRFAARTPEDLNEMLGFSLDESTLAILRQARAAGIPIFANPYYLSLMDTRPNPVSCGADFAIRQYVLYSQDLVDEFGQIQAWEKEDIVEPGKPNAAGWITPDTNLHRRYPDVAIVIPKTMGRACGGLCSSCQRMYGFQNGTLNFNHDRLRAKGNWKEHLGRLIAYFENDSRLRDILITGGDALMSADNVLEEILDSVYRMAKRKKLANEKRKPGEKFAPILRVRFGTRLPVYLPMRIQPPLVKILARFKTKAARIGIRQFIFQAHFESPMEITPETLKSVKMLNSAGWVVTNQHVFTSAASRRGHGAKLRQVMNDIGILPYYFFSVKGFRENRAAFTPNARIVQEMLEEKKTGTLQKRFHERIKRLPFDAAHITANIKHLRRDANLPFLSTDRNLMNLPGVGKSLTFRTIGITHDGRRILEFDHDATRSHSPIIEKMGKITVVESKSISGYFKQLEEMGEDLSEYESCYGYSLSETEARMPVYEYPDLSEALTPEITNLKIDSDA